MASYRTDRPIVLIRCWEPAGGILKMKRRDEGHGYVIIRLCNHAEIRFALLVLPVGAKVLSSSAGLIAA